MEIEHFNCHSLESIYLPDSVEKINLFAFAYWWSLKSIQLPDSVKIIGDLAFWDCKSLKYIIIKNLKVYFEYKDGFKDCDSKVVPGFSIDALVNELDWF